MLPAGEMSRDTSLHSSLPARAARCARRFPAPAQTSISLEGSQIWHAVFVKWLQDNSTALKKKKKTNMVYISKFHPKGHLGPTSLPAVRGHPRTKGSSFLNAAQGFIWVRTGRLEEAKHCSFALRVAAQSGCCCHQDSWPADRAQPPAAGTDLASQGWRLPLLSLRHGEGTPLSNVLLQRSERYPRP